MQRLFLMALAVLLLSAPAAAQARTANVIVGIGDQQATTFTDTHWQALHVRYTRYFVRYDAISTPYALAQADAYMAAAKAANVHVLLHFSTNNYGRKKAKLPSVAAYKSKVGALVKRYKKLGVKDFGVWNEANNQTEPTYRSPSRAAQFYLALRKLCSGCNIVALDVLDQPGVGTYISKFFAALPSSSRSSKLIVGIHDYGDVNRFRTKGTKAIITATRKRDRRARFWLTETGGLAQFKPNFPCNLSRQKRATDQMFKLIKGFDKDLERAYSFNWHGTDCTGFDAGLINSDGTTRPAYTAFKTGLKGVRR